MRLRRIVCGFACSSALVVCTISLLVGCGSSRRGGPLAEPLPRTPGVHRGELVFMHNCNTCHPGGSAGVGPALNDKPLPPCLIRFQVRHGLGVMPKFSRDRISDEQLDNLTEYVKALRRQKDIPPAK